MFILLWYSYGFSNYSTNKRDIVLLSSLKSCKNNFSFNNKLNRICLPHMLIVLQRKNEDNVVISCIKQLLTVISSKSQRFQSAHHPKQWDQKQTLQFKIVWSKNKGSRQCRYKEERGHQMWPSRSSGKDTRTNDSRFLTQRDCEFLQLLCPRFATFQPKKFSKSSRWVFWPLRALGQKVHSGLYHYLYNVVLWGSLILVRSGGFSSTAPSITMLLCNELDIRIKVGITLKPG